MTSSKRVFEYKQIELSDSLTINYVEFGSGQGDTILFLHGYADSWRSFERVLQSLPPHYHCFALDLRGHGDSSKPKGSYGMNVFVDDISLFQQKLGINKCTLIGHSMGSFIGQIFAATYPMQTEKLILISSSIAAKGNDVLIEVQDEIMGLKDPIGESFIAEFQKPSLPVPAEFMQNIISASKKIPSDIWKAVFLELLKTDTGDILNQITSETLVLWGARDGIFAKDKQALLTSGIKNSSLIEYDAGHALHWEIPVQVAHDIDQFLSKEK